MGDILVWNILEMVKVKECVVLGYDGDFMLGKDVEYYDIFFELV